MRLVLGIAVGLAAAPATAMAASYEYLTSYNGTYGFSQHFRYDEARPDGSDTLQAYAFAVYDYQRITVRADRSYSRVVTRYMAAKGTEKLVSVQGSDSMAGTQTSTRDCRIASSLKPVITNSGGANVEPVPVRRNPAITVSWELPDYGDSPTNDAPPFTVTGTQTCRSDYHNHFLDWTPGNPAGGLVGVAHLPPTHKLQTAFGGSQTIHYDDIPWERNFHDATVSDDRTDANGAHERARVTVDSTVTFARIRLKTPRSEVSKIGALLLREGFASLGGQTPPGGPPAGTSGEEEDVVVPGVGPGEASLDVNGTVVQDRGNRLARASAATPVLLARAKATVPRALRPFTLEIVPTAQGRSILGRSHAAISGHWELSFKPRGSRRTFSGRRAITIPARP